MTDEGGQREPSLYDEPALYDLAFGPGDYEAFYADAAVRGGGPALELACGTGQLVVPIAARGIHAAGIDLSRPMLDAAARRAEAAGVALRLVEADMRGFDLGERFATVFVARNSLLHLHTTDDLRACFHAVRRHLLPGGAFVFDVFNPRPAILARRPDERMPLMRLDDPARGEVTLEGTSDYDAAAQVNRSTLYFSAPGAPDFLVVPLHLRCIFPQELPLLVEACGFRLESRRGGPGGEPFVGTSRRQVCVCRPA